MHREDSEFVRHVDCSKCGSSDANSEWSDGHEYCFSCGHYKHPDGTSEARTVKHVAGLLPADTLRLQGLHTRKITEETCKRFGYKVTEYKGSTAHVAPYFDNDGNLVAQHIRRKGKEFPWLGEPKSALPFGANVWPKTGKMLVVTEGEIDALSMSQAQGNKWPVVSIGCGAGPQIRKYFARRLDYFKGFEKIVLMFDMDGPGRQAAQDAADVIGPRAHIAELPMKDANEMLVAGRVEELINAMWKAKKYTPEHLVEMASLREKSKQGVRVGVPWPWPTLTKLTHGRRTGEVYTLAAGTGIGKSQVFTQIIEQTVRELHEPCAVFFLEQEPTETTLRILGVMHGKTFHIPNSDWTQDDLEDAWKTYDTAAPIFLYDSFGCNDWQTIKERIKFLALAEDVKHVFIDHLTALAATEDDERKTLEVIMAEVGALVKELDIAVYMISHLATPEGKPHEEGGRVMIRHFKGSRSIGFWSHFMFALERDQQCADPKMRHITTFRVLKDRFTGQATGATFHLGFDPETGRLHEVDVDNEEEETDGQEFSGGL